MWELAEQVLIWRQLRQRCPSMISRTTSAPAAARPLTRHLIMALVIALILLVIASVAARVL
jgi:hypothetical protein